MKKILLLLLLFIVVNIQAQNSFPSSGNVTINGSTNLNARLTLQEAGGAYTFIGMKDDESPNGIKYIHTNSNNIGFLNGQGSWIFKVDNAGNATVPSSVTTTESYVNGWYRNNVAGTGLYNQATGTGIYSPYAGMMSIYNNGSFYVPGYTYSVGGLSVSSNAAGTHTSIALSDDESPYGVKYIHANSNLVGFLSGAGGWIFNVDNAGNTSVGNNLTAYGTILAPRVKVAVVWGANWNWADYVFAKDYKLKPLSEVEAYINTNKHLEGIPTTEEVKKDGIDVAPMTAKLLEKIEELTLHLIELNKKVELLENANSKK